MRQSNIVDVNLTPGESAGNTGIALRDACPVQEEGEKGGALHHSSRQLRVPSGIQKCTIYVLQAMRLIISLPASAHETFLQSLPLSDFIPFHHLTADDLSVLLSRDGRSRR